MSIYIPRDNNTIGISGLAQAFQEHTPIGYFAQTTSNYTSQIINNSDPYSHQLTSPQALEAANLGQTLQVVA